MSSLWIAAKENMQGLRRWHVYRKRIVIACLLLALLVWFLVATVARTQGPEEGPMLGSEAVATFMRQKLLSSQKLLEAIALEDYEGIEKNSQDISLLTQEEMWRVLQSQDYLQYSKEFRRAADAVTANARKKNLDGAALGYVDMTLKCVQCHKYVRGVKVSAPPDLRKPAEKGK
jgi:hypothetical protein